jgi:hypothetical protein
LRTGLQLGGHCRWIWSQICCPSSLPQPSRRWGGDWKGNVPLHSPRWVKLLELPKFLNGGNWALLLSMTNVVTTWCGSSCTTTSSTSMPMSQDGGPASRQSLTPSRCQVGRP